MNNLDTKNILKIILEIAQSIKFHGLILNERYLHHYFSHKLQEKYNSLNLTEDTIAITIHPEWSTYKEKTGLNFGRYRKINEIYMPKANGTGGLIDFAIGDYHKPEIGIEFTLKYGWSNEEIVFDFLKLLDKSNPFKTVISYNVILSENGLTKGGHLTNLENHMNDAIPDVKDRLKNDFGLEHKEIYLIISEIDQDNNRRHWYYDKVLKKFINGLPNID